MKSRKIKKTPPRLSTVFQKYDPPLYFITINTWQHRAVLNNDDILTAFLEYGQKNAKDGRAIGKFVIMPDHIHLFARLSQENRLNDFVRLMKQHLDKTLQWRGVEKPWWQPGFFDHLMRNSESYRQKWEYVHDNPVRKKLVGKPESWPYQGEILRIDRV
jgi:putative transposase